MSEFMDIILENDNINTLVESGKRDNLKKAVIEEFGLSFYGRLLFDLTEELRIDETEYLSLNLGNLSETMDTVKSNALYFLKAGGVDIDINESIAEKFMEFYNEELDKNLKSLLDEDIVPVNVEKLVEHSILEMARPKRPEHPNTKIRDTYDVLKSDYDFLIFPCALQAVAQKLNKANIDFKNDTATAIAEFKNIVSSAFAGCTKRLGFAKLLQGRKPTVDVRSHLYNLPKDMMKFFDSKYAKIYADLLAFNRDATFYKKQLASGDQKKIDKAGQVLQNKFKKINNKVDSILKTYPAGGSGRLSYGELRKALLGR